MSILFAIPCFGGVVSSATTNGLLGLAKSNIESDFLFVNNQSLIPMARSDIANHFINNTKFEYLMFIDADLAFSPIDVFKLVEMGEQHVMGTYRHKDMTERYSFGVIPEWHPKYPAIKVSYNVGGFSLIHRSVYDTIAKKFEHLKYVPSSNSRQISDGERDNSYHFYETPIINGSITPEDFAFHDKCNQSGITNWLRADVNLGHNGNTTFFNESLYEQLNKNIPRKHTR